MRNVVQMKLLQDKSKLFSIPYLIYDIRDDYHICYHRNYGREERVLVIKCIRLNEKCARIVFAVRNSICQTMDQSQQ